MFAALREYEEILQKDLEPIRANLGAAEELERRYPEAMRAFATLHRLHAVERFLMWMHCNATGSPEEKRIRKSGEG